MKLQRTPTRRALVFALAATAASALLAVLEALPLRGSHPAAAVGFGAVALLWWVVFVRWKRAIDA